MSAVETFEDLLRRLGHQHELEVRSLREQVVQLQKEAQRGQSSVMFERTKDETTASTADPFTDSRFDDKGCLPPTMQICRPVLITKPDVDSEVIINGSAQAIVETPDNDALEAALQIALDDTRSDLTSELMEEIAVSVAHDRVQEDKPRVSSQNCSQPRVNSNEPPWWESQQVPPNGDIDDLGDNFQQARVSSKNEKEMDRSNSKSLQIVSSSQSDDFRNSWASVVIQDGNMAEAMKKFVDLESPTTTMGRWERLIEFAQTVQFLDSLPTLSTSWADTAKDDPNQKSMFRMGNLKSMVAKTNSSSGQEGDASAAGIEESGNRKHSNDNLNRPSLLSRIMLPFMMHPTCRRRVIWDIGGITLLLHDVVFIPIQQAFEGGTQGLGKGYEDFLAILDLLGASFWTMDIFVSFLTGYYTSEGFVETMPAKVARNYMRTWFPMDFMIVTVDWCTMFIGMSAASGYMRLGKTVSRIMRVLRLLRFLKMNTTMRELMERINSEYLLQLVNLMKTLLVIVIVNHYIACVWFGVGAASFATSRWTEKFLVNYPGDFAYAYATALHWSLTQFTPASMEVVPQNAVERFFTIFVIINALVAFSSFVSSITAAMTHIRNINARQVQEEASIRQFFSEHKISHGTASRVWHFVRQRKGSNMKRMKESDVVALKHLPPKIKEDMRLEIYFPILGDHAFFAELHTRDKASLTKICNACLSEFSLNIAEEVYADKKQHIPAMIFVSMGTLVYIPAIENEDDQDEESREEHLHDYQIHKQHWVCETALWADRAKIHGSFVAAFGSVDLLLIDSEKAGAVLKASSSCAVFSARYGDLYIKAFREHCCIANYEANAEVNLLFNDQNMPHKWVQQAKDSLGEGGLRNSMGRGFGNFLGSSAGHNF